MTKDERLARIRAIVSQYEIETQEDLLRHLQEAGIVVTQATVSRDIKELQLTKTMGSHGRYKYAVPTAPPVHDLETVRRRIREVFVSLARAENLLVLKVLPGHGQSIAWLMDNVPVPGLLGTIAGDDTILLIVQDRPRAEALEEILKV
ncbi:arginine repressor [Sulfobacillus harzensis]|uniref:Arginine repressor n=1 Tax=Sulfobacillus harzensis TaxID=2729629 RepID=A0A7Y0Q313_9FIRM|nr:arginine repressor [Sulfobacillus harzensis]NMP21724.1 arginine repressor [Sulfobacillus harzensis]